MKRILSILAIISFLAVFFPAHAQDDFDAAFDNMEKAFEEAAQETEDVWDQVDTAQEQQWEAQVKREEEEWEKLRAEVERKWDEFYYSTNKEWVDYDDDKNTRSRVNFETGEIEISVLIPVEEKPKPEIPATTQEIPKPKIPAITQEIPKPEVSETISSEKLLLKIKHEEKKHIIAQAEKKIERQVKKIFSTGNQVQQEVLKGQVENEKGETVTARNIAGYVRGDVSPKMKLEKKIIKSKDGKDRLKFIVKIKMVPKHLEIRAKKYKEQVRKYADKYRLDPALVFAVIHTESYFNPLAKSRIPAYGLMQLVPRFGALESYHYLYGEKKLLPADYLYNPENNIELGATYLHLLHDRYFGKVKDAGNRQSISIAAYNCGPTRMNKILVRKYDVDNMENEELVELIRKIVPDETKEYIVRVQKRMSLYEGMI